MTSSFSSRSPRAGSSSGSGSSGGRDGGRERKPGGSRGGFAKVRKFCRFCKDTVAHIDYKNVELLRSSIPERAKIQPRRLSGTCDGHQRMLREAIKRARHLALIPFMVD